MLLSTAVILPSNCGVVLHGMRRHNWLACPLADGRFGLFPVLTNDCLVTKSQSFFSAKTGL